jgi:hypothetical protein
VNGIAFTPSAANWYHIGLSKSISQRLLVGKGSGASVLLFAYQGVK